MLDSKTVISQVQDLQVILHDIHAEGMSLSESFQVAAIIEKLPPLWKEFKNYLKHKRKEMRPEDMIVRLRIEEDNRVSEKKAGKGFMESKANVVEHGQTSTIPKRGSTMATVLSKVLRRSSKASAMCATSKGTVLRTVVVARNKGIRRRNALKQM